MSRRAVDAAIDDGKVWVNDRPAETGQQVGHSDKVVYDNRLVSLGDKPLTLILNKPVGYVVSRNGQGNPTIYDLLPSEYHILKPVGRLDKDSSGLLVLTNDGQLAHQLTHPSFEKTKVYQIELDRPLLPNDQKALEAGVVLEDGMSRFNLSGKGVSWTVTMHEGRNRQIRRTFEKLNYRVDRLHRTEFGQFKTMPDEEGKYSLIS